MGKDEVNRAMLKGMQLQIQQMDQQFNKALQGCMKACEGLSLQQATCVLFVLEVNLTDNVRANTHKQFGREVG